MALKVARRGRIPPFIVMDVMQAAADRVAQGKDVIHLEVGQPSTGAPKGVIAAAHAALDSQALGYTLALGHEPLRQRIARHYRDAYGVAIAPARVAVTVGSSGAFLLAFLAAFEPGDRVGIAAPGYPCYRQILTALGVEPVSIPVGVATGFQAHRCGTRTCLGSRRADRRQSFESRPAAFLERQIWMLWRRGAGHAACG